MNSSAKAGDDAREIAELKPAAGSLPQGDGLDAGELALERELEQFLRDKGLQVYTPNVDAFRRRVQKAYLESDFSKKWPAGLVDKINAL